MSAELGRRWYRAWGPLWDTPLGISMQAQERALPWTQQFTRSLYAEENSRCKRMNGEMPINREQPNCSQKGMKTDTQTDRGLVGGLDLVPLLR